MEQKRKRVLLLILGLLILFSGLYLLLTNSLSPKRFGIVAEDSLVQVPFEGLPEGTLYLTEARRAYGRGTMTLVIPAIDVNTPVGESTEPDYLKEMPGLYEFAQMPGYNDGNVSIAGHRDIHDMVFYALDKVAEGDYLYLLYQDRVYKYLYKDSKVVAPTDWSVIEPQGFSCLTLTTCDPIGTTLKRLILRAELVGIDPLSDSYPFDVHTAD